MNIGLFILWMDYWINQKRDHFAISEFIWSLATDCKKELYPLPWGGGGGVKFCVQDTCNRDASSAVFKGTFQNGGRRFRPDWLKCFRWIRSFKSGQQQKQVYWLILEFLQLIFYELFMHSLYTLYLRTKLIWQRWLRRKVEQKWLEILLLLYNLHIFASDRIKEDSNKKYF